MRRKTVPPITSKLFPVRDLIAMDGRHNIPYLTGWMYAVYGAAPSTPVPLHSTLVTSWGRQGEPTQKIFYTRRWCLSFRVLSDCRG